MFDYNVMPFSLKNVDATYQQIINKIDLNLQEH